VLLRDRARLIVGSFGLGLVLWGLMLFLGQMYGAIESGRLESISVASVVNRTTLRTLLPDAIVEAPRRIFGVEFVDSVDGLLDHIPLALFLGVIGGIVTWRTLLRESPASRGR
jgi:hypothetical protein